MIKVQGVCKSFAGEHVLEDITFDIASGEIVVLLGSSGVGKTVLLKHLIGLIAPDQGRVLIDGVDITSLSEEGLLRVRKSMGYLFQEGALYDFMDVFDNVAFPLREHTSLSGPAIADKVREVLKLVGLQDADRKFPAQLSGGMKKRAGLARAIVLGAKILLCDEPTSGLDPIRSRDISDLIRCVAKKIGSTTVITSHDIDNSLRIADRLILLNESRIVAVGTPQAMRVHQEGFVREFLRV
ncbi:MAG: ATP-binding cassette domain-containing protein [Candidatus Omnitrophica bacterium]|nr:ATP-binding cassette domain-containing protein [Candidatus Omnitrophota bacterium]